MVDTDRKRRLRFEALFGEYGPDIDAYCRWRARSLTDAQDAVAEVFLTAWRRLDEVPRGGAGRVWLYGTARRVIANQHRADTRRTRLHQRLAAAPVTLQAGQADADPVIEHVHAALRRLKPGDQEVLLLSEWEGLSPAGIARVLGCSAVTVRGRLHRARRRFRQAYEELRSEPGRSGRPEPADRASARRDHPRRPLVGVAAPARGGDRS